jgi:hypothetical protein
VWVVGMLVVLALGAGLTVVIGWKPRSLRDSPLWDAPGLGGMFTGIAGTIAGFSIASATFIASTSQGRDSPAFAAVVGMLLISFLILMSTAMMYSSTPTFSGAGDDSGMVMQSLTNVLANAGYFIGVALGWLALRPLLVLIELPSVADAFTWLLLVTALAGSARLAGLTFRLTVAPGQACLLIPIIGFGLPAIYWFVSARVGSLHWPTTDSALYLALIAFAIAVVALAMQTGILLVHGNVVWQQRLTEHGHRLALAVGQATVSAIALVWFAVATT